MGLDLFLMFFFSIFAIHLVFFYSFFCGTFSFLRGLPEDLDQNGDSLLDFPEYVQMLRSSGRGGDLGGEIRGGTAMVSSFGTT